MTFVAGARLGVCGSRHFVTFARRLAFNTRQQCQQRTATARGGTSPPDGKRDLLRIVNSPFGRVLQAIRENDFRVEAIGLRTVVYRTLSNVIAALLATVAGALLALWLRYTGPDTTLSFEIMLDILLIVVIGGMGTLYGAVIGSVLFVLAQNYLQDLLKLGAGAFEGVPVLGAVISPDRWLLWLGVLFVLSVYYFPTGVVGRLRALAIRAATR